MVATTIFLICLLFLLIFLATLYILIYFLSVEMPSLKVIGNTIVRDIRVLYIYYQMLKYLKKCLSHNHTVSDLFSMTAKKYKNEVCFVIQNEEWTYQQVEEFSNKIANGFLAQGYKKGDEIALIMENCPEYVCIWLGLSKIGVVTALVNTNLREESLGHSVNILETKAIIFGKNFTNVVHEVLPFLENKNNMEFYCYSENNEKVDATPFPTKSLNSLLADASPENVKLPYSKPGFLDKLFYIYTSGTTGLPKAAVIKHSRYLWITISAQYAGQLNDFETFYNPLPFYHLSGAVFFLGVTLVRGGKVVIRKKFSATNFWNDVLKHKVTVGQYIGEICRYLLNQPKRPEETQHCMRLMFGNGLKPHLWKEFQERFKIKQIVEIYGSTEGNANFANLYGKEGAVGFIPRTCARFFPLDLVKRNEETGDLLRNEKGLCIRCKPGEPGELVGKIVRSNPLISFDGYANQNETNKKIARDCFQHGDIIFRTGDILIMDEEGHLYFVDRTGDTYRFKGENISTGEVENIISKTLGHIACVVYGVEIPNVDGRAGMAAIQMDVKDIDFKNLYQNVKKKLPPYAVSLFLRISNNLEVTGTFKLRKVALQNQGFDPEKISDPLFVLDNKKENYVPLTKDLYADIVNGRMKL